MQIRAYQPADQPDVVSLWRRAGLTRPWNDPHKDIARKMSVQSQWFLVGVLDKRVIATVMAGYDGHRGWINYLAVDPDHRQGGRGRAIMQHAEQLLLEAGCPKINLQIRKDNAEAISFYETIGFREDDVVSFGKRLIDDQGNKPLNTQVLYKILTKTEWDDARAAGVFSGCGIDLTDGFIHLSGRDQVQTTAKLYFAGRGDLRLVAVDAGKLGETLRWETSRDGALFPHVYGDIPLEAVISVDPLPREHDGSHRFPDSFGLPEQERE
ncbi:Acetyltransferase YpeA [Stieleria maiorica]|uniref:Acetyltransferase YpeA n=1 Tax=Stieleria maiorica TaxID=2795974 RepID=A0A5B9MEV0_9BACT|nr:GNAT family acetyltransferase [Stieleria maiorica]QEF98686.1 Acetyltransferase YpeA [Stieleria maiorica]